MFGSVGRRVLKGVRCQNVFKISITHPGDVGFESGRVLIIRRYSLLARKVNEIDDQRSFAVSYLMKSCGLSLENAQLAFASKRLPFKTPEKPDAVLALLKSYGFTDAQISRIALNCPQVLSANPKKTLLPKLEFYRSIGTSGVEIGNVVSVSHGLLTLSLKSNIIPCYELLKSFIDNEKKIVKALSIWFRVIPARMFQNVTQNVLALRNLGASPGSISMLLCFHPWVICCSHDCFNVLVDEVKEMGFHPSKWSFLMGMKVIKGKGKDGILRKVEVYERFGWSREEVMAAFRGEPTCMALSEKRIMSTMDFFVNKMGWPSKLLAKRPRLLCYSLEKRIIPRCLVAQVLLSSNLLKNDLSRIGLLSVSEEDFLKRYVVKYQESLPQLMDVYQGKVPPVACPSEKKFHCE